MFIKLLSFYLANTSPTQLIIWCDNRLICKYNYDLKLKGSSWYESDHVITFLRIEETFCVSK